MAGTSVRASEQTRGGTRGRSQSLLVTFSRKWHAIIFVVLYRWKQTSRSSPRSRAGDYIKARPPGGREHQSHRSNGCVFICPGLLSFLPHRRCPNLGPLSQWVPRLDHASHMAGSPPSSLRSSVTSSVRLSLAPNPPHCLFLLPP